MIVIHGAIDSHSRLIVFLSPQKVLCFLKDGSLMYPQVLFSLNSNNKMTN